MKPLSLSHNVFFNLSCGFFLLFFICAAVFPAWGQPTTAEHYQKGLQLSQNKNWTDAAVEFEKAVRLDPGNELAAANLGVALSQTGKHKDALLAFEQALKLGYDHPRLRYNRGISFAKLNLLDDAIVELETALKMDSRMVRAMYNLGILYSHQGRRKEATELLDKLYIRNNKLARKLFEKIPPEYKIISMDNGGSLTGRITLTGTVPKARSFHLIHAPNIEFCSRISDGKGHRLVHDFTVSDSGGLKDTVISILGVKKGKPFPQPIQKLNIARCHADKYVIGVRNGENILLENTDPIRHEIATYEFNNSYVKQVENKAMLKKTSQVRSAFIHPRSDEFLIKCNLHPFLQTRGFMVANPYYSVSDSQGRFTIRDIPPGTYDVLAWHPFIPIQKGTITINAGEGTQIDFQFNGDNARRKLYQDDIKGYRFNTWYDSFEKFYGGPRIDDPVEILQKF